MTSKTPHLLSRMAKVPGARLDLPSPKATTTPEPEAIKTPAPTTPPVPLTLDDASIKALGASVSQAVQKMGQVIEGQADANERFAEMLSDAIRTGMGVQQAKESRPARWTFTVKRDLRGLIETIEAKASN